MINNDNCITSYIHCAQCYREKPANVSQAKWSKLDIGFTDIGLQVWCRRHGTNVVHINFEGAKHPANMERKATPV